ncbi:MAG: Gfo/Idh/MocA family oxidoreductase [Kiritimatiellaeota bacterium]|nr:Gfo/Idh/MocA family oxidoreductase [Kiritimatiellota bacterium]
MMRTAFIGTGGIASVHLRYLKMRRDVRVAALCDMKREQAVKRQQEFGGEVFTDYRMMLDQVKPDAVWLCTPPIVRREPLLACADRGIPVFCEKPAERREAEAAATAGGLTKRKAHVQIGYVFRCMPAVQQLRVLMRDDPIHLVQSFYGCNVSLTMELPAWFYDKAKSGGALVDQATHNLDLLRYLFGEVKEVRGSARNPVHKQRKGYTIDETLGLVFTFASGIIGTHVHTWVGDAWRNELVFSGEKRLYRLFPGGRLVVEQPSAGAHNKLSRHLTKTATKGVFEFQPGSRPIYEYENEIFLKMVKTGDWSINPCDYTDGWKSLQLTLACDKALTQDRVVRL